MSQWSEKIPKENLSETVSSTRYFFGSFKTQINNFRKSSKKFLVDLLTRNFALNLSGAIFFVGLGYSLKWWYKDQLFVVLLKQNLPALSEFQQNVSSGESILNGESQTSICFTPQLRKPFQGVQSWGYANPLIDRIDLYTNHVRVKFKQPWEKHVYERFIGVFGEPAQANIYKQVLTIKKKDCPQTLLTSYSSGVSTLPLQGIQKGSDMPSEKSTTPFYLSPLNIASPTETTDKKPEEIKQSKALQQIMGFEETNNFSGRLYGSKGVANRLSTYILHTPEKPIFSKRLFKLSPRNLCFLNLSTSIPLYPEALLTPTPFAYLPSDVKLEGACEAGSSKEARRGKIHLLTTLINNSTEEVSYPLQLTKKVAGWQPSPNLLLLNSYLDEIPYKLENTLQAYFPKKDSQLFFLSTSFRKSINFVNNKSIIRSINPVNKETTPSASYARPTLKEYRSSSLAYLTPSSFASEGRYPKLEGACVRSEGMNASLAGYSKVSTQEIHSRKRLDLFNTYSDASLTPSKFLFPTKQTETYLKKTHLFETKKLLQNQLASLINSFPIDFVEKSKAIVEKDKHSPTLDLPLLASLLYPASQAPSGYAKRVGVSKASRYNNKMNVQNQQGVGSWETQTVIEKNRLKDPNFFATSDSYEMGNESNFFETNENHLVDVTKKVVKSNKIDRLDVNLTRANAADAVGLDPLLLLNTLGFTFNNFSPLTNPPILLTNNKLGVVVNGVTNIFKPAKPGSLQTILHSSEQRTTPQFVNFLASDSIDLVNKVKRGPLTASQLSTWKEYKPTLRSKEQEESISFYFNIKNIDWIVFQQSINGKFNSVLKKIVGERNQPMTTQSTRLMFEFIKEKKGNFLNKKTKMMDFAETIDLIKMKEFLLTSKEYNPSFSNNKVGKFILPRFTLPTQLRKPLMQSKKGLAKLGIEVDRFASGPKEGKQTDKVDSTNVNKVSFKPKETKLETLNNINVLDKYINFDKNSRYMSGYVYPDIGSNFLKAHLDQWLGKNKNLIPWFSSHYLDDKSIACYTLQAEGLRPVQRKENKQKSIEFETEKSKNSFFRFTNQMMGILDKACLFDREISIKRFLGNPTPPTLASPLASGSINFLDKIKASASYAFLPSDRTQASSLPSGYNGMQTLLALYESEPNQRLENNKYSGHFKNIDHIEVPYKKFNHYLAKFPGFSNPNQFFTTLPQISCGNESLVTGFSKPQEKSGELLTSEGLSLTLPKKDKMTEQLEYKALHSFLRTGRKEKPFETEAEKLSFEKVNKPNEPLNYVEKFDTPSGAKPYFMNNKEINKLFIQKNGCNSRKVAYSGIVVQRNKWTKDFQPFSDSKKLLNGTSNSSIWGTLFLGPENPLTDRQCHFFGQKQLSTLDTNSLQRDYLRQLGKEILTQANSKGYTELSKFSSIERAKILSLSKKVNSFFFKKRKYSYLLEPKDQWHLLFQEQLCTALEDCKKYPSSTTRSFEETNTEKFHGRIKVSAPLIMARFPKKLVQSMGCAKPEETLHNKLPSYQLEQGLSWRPFCHLQKSYLLKPSFNKQNLDYSSILVQNKLSEFSEYFANSTTSSLLYPTEVSKSLHSSNFLINNSVPSFGVSSWETSKLEKINGCAVPVVSMAPYLSMKFPASDSINIVSLLCKPINFLCFPSFGQDAKPQVLTPKGFKETYQYKPFAFLPLDRTQSKGKVCKDKSINNMDNSLDVQNKEGFVDPASTNLRFVYPASQAPSGYAKLEGAYEAGYSKRQSQQTKKFNKTIKGNNFSSVCSFSKPVIISHYPLFTERFSEEINAVPYLNKNSLFYLPLHSEALLTPSNLNAPQNVRSCEARRLGLLSFLRTGRKRKNHLLGIQNMCTSLLVQEPLNCNSWVVLNQWVFLVALLFWVEQTLLDNVFPALFALEQILLNAAGVKTGGNNRTDGLRISKNETPKFQNLAGIDGLLGELSELVLFLRGQRNLGERFWNKWFASGPKEGKQTKNSYGVLLTGSPGTGKTFLVRALANEAKVPVLILSASTLTANKLSNNKPSSSIRHAFKRAKQLAPCILFIDEIDALGKSRGKIVTDINEIVAETSLKLTKSTSHRSPMGYMFSYEQFGQNCSNLTATLLNKWKYPLQSTILQESNEINQNSLCQEKLVDILKIASGTRSMRDYNRTGSGIASELIDSSRFKNTNETKSDNLSTKSIDPRFAKGFAPQGEDLRSKEEMTRGKFGPLTQLLVSMDGVSSFSGVLIMGATNRPELLDPALTRPGRFEKIICIDKPAEQNRIEILQLYSQNLGIQQQIPWSYLATRTVGLTTADLAVAMNYSSLRAIIQGSGHTLETIEYGLSCITRL